MSPARMFFGGSSRRRSRSRPHTDGSNKSSLHTGRTSVLPTSHETARTASPKKIRSRCVGAGSMPSAREVKSSVSRTGSTKTLEIRPQNVHEQHPVANKTTDPMVSKRRHRRKTPSLDPPSMRGGASKESFSEQRRGRSRGRSRNIAETARYRDHSRSRASLEPVSRDPVSEQEVEGLAEQLTRGLHPREDHSRPRTPTQSRVSTGGLSNPLPAEQGRRRRQPQENHPRYHMSKQAVAPKVISNLEVMGLTEQLTRRPRSESDSKSGASKRSRRSEKSSRSSKSKQGHSIEVQVSRTILQTAKESTKKTQFVRKGASTIPAKSVSDILEDLFSVAAEAGLDAVPVSEALFPRDSWTETLTGGIFDQDESSRHSKPHPTVSSSTDEHTTKSLCSEHTRQAQNLSRVPKPTSVQKKIPTPTIFPNQNSSEKSKLERHLELSKGKPPLAGNDARTLQSNETSIFAGLESLPDEKQDPSSHCQTKSEAGTSTRMQKIHEKDADHSVASSNTCSTSLRLGSSQRREQDSRLQELSEPSSYFMTAESATEDDLEGLAHVDSNADWVTFDEDPFKKSVTPTAQLEGRFSGSEEYVSFTARHTERSPAGTEGSSSERSGKSSDSPTCVSSIGRDRTGPATKPRKTVPDNGLSWEPFQSSPFFHS